MDSVSYSNDTHPDVAYLLVFKYISLQERVRLRIICHRWKNVIETDCAQMTTLRVFGDCTRAYFNTQNADFFKRQIRRQTRPPLPEGMPKYDPHLGNTILLYRPSFYKDDISFLARLFPAVQNLALGWKYAQEVAQLLICGIQSSRIKGADDCLEPNIFDGLLRHWAPSLREVHISFLSWDWNRPYINAEQSRQFWESFNLMTNLEALSIEGIDQESAPCWLLPHPSLREIVYYTCSHAKDEDKPRPPGLLTGSPRTLAYIAPRLELLDANLTDEGEDVWHWQLPETVNKLSIVGRFAPKGPITSPCYSVTHLELNKFEVLALRCPNWEAEKIIRSLPVKFPNVRSLKVDKGIEVFDHLCDIGKQILAVKAKLRDRPNKEIRLADFIRYKDISLESIEEFHLGFVLDRYAGFGTKDGLGSMKEATHLFAGISVQFPRLKKLIFSIPVDEEKTHQLWFERFQECKSTLLPSGVELKYTLTVEANRAMDAFSFPDGEEYAEFRAACHLSPDCIFVRQGEDENKENSEK